MKRVSKHNFSICVTIILVFMATFASAQSNFSTAPKTNDGKKWRIAYYEGGDYPDYQKSLIAMVEVLMGLNWITKTKIPAQKDNLTKPLWQWLNANAKSQYIEFAADAHYSAGWDKELQKKMPAKIIRRLNKTGDIDLIIAAGTKAGQDLANNKHSTSTLVISTSDPLSAGIIKSIEDSGFDHVHARIDPYRYESQLRVFHDIIGFKRLGVAYHKSETGRSYGAIDKVESVAKERGFELVRCYTKSETDGKKIADARINACYQDLCAKSDAIYVTINPAGNPDYIPKIVTYFNRAKIPSFSQSGSKEVRQGVLMSISKASFKYVGDFYARTTAMIFNGAKPRLLNQVFEHPPKIAINLKTAGAIEFNPPVDVLVAADEIIRQ